MTDALDRRDGLPVRFRYLESIYPRADWPQLDLHPTARQWLDIHDWFRGQMADLQALGKLWCEGRITSVEYRTETPPRLLQLFNQLHHHHERETHRAFPRLSAVEPRMNKGFALLDRDHEAIERLLLTIAEETRNLLRAEGGPDALTPLAAQLCDRIDQGTKLIGRHLWDEEDVVVPVLTLRGDSLRL